MENTNIISKQEALEKGLKKYFTGKVCKNNHLCEKWTKKSACVICLKNSKNKWKKNNPEKIKKNSDKRYLEKSEHILNLNKNWRENNSEKKKILNKTWDLANPEKLKSKKAKRRASELQRIPSWTNFEKIQAIYKQRIELEKITGLKYHVDHIIPLQGKYVSGLHVENNLQILKATENYSKSNKHESDSYWS